MARTEFKAKGLGAIVEVRVHVKLEDWLGSLGVPSGGYELASAVLFRERVPVEVAGRQTVEKDETGQLGLRLEVNLDPLRDVLDRIEAKVVEALEEEKAR